MAPTLKHLAETVLSDTILENIIEGSRNTAACNLFTNIKK